jgi:hypothetical protein
LLKCTDDWNERMNTLTTLDVPMSDDCVSSSFMFDFHFVLVHHPAMHPVEVAGACLI